MYIDSKLDSTALNALKDDYRDFDDFIEEIAEEAVRTFKNSDITINVYNGTARSNPSSIVEYEYDGRLEILSKTKNQKNQKGRFLVIFEITKNRPFLIRNGEKRSPLITF